MNTITATDLATYIAYAVAIASAVAAVLPQGKPGSAWAIARSVIDTLAINMGNAKNAPKA